MSVNVVESLKQFLHGNSFDENLLLGNAALRHIVKQKFMEKYGTADVESLVSDNLDNEKLARACVDSKLDGCISFQNWKEADISLVKEQIEIFKAEAARYPSHCLGMLNAPSIAADVVKSTLGGVFKNSNYNYDTLYESFEKICSPLYTKEKPALHPYDELNKLHKEKKIDLKIAHKITPDGKNNVRIEIHRLLYEDMISDLDMRFLQNRAAFSILQTMENQKAAMCAEIAKASSSNRY